MSDLKLFPYYNKETGLVEMLDPVSGTAVRIQKDKYTELQENDLEQVLMPDGRTVWIEKGLDKSRLPKGRWAYSRIIGAIIAQRLAEGTHGGLTKICQMADMPPYSIVCMWRREHDEFREMLIDAKKDRAEALADEALDIADKVTPYKDDIAKAKLQVEARQWSAEKSDPKQFGTQKASDGQGASVVTLILNTGIIRPGDPGFREVTPNGSDQEQVGHKDLNGTADNAGLIGEPSGVGDDGLGRQSVPEDEPGTGWTPGQF